MPANGKKRDGIRIFGYHGVVERKTDLLLERNFHLLDVFRSHVRFLRRFRVLAHQERRERAIVQHKISSLRRIPAVAMQHLMGTITHVNTQFDVAALTFDDGPHPTFTGHLLDILEEHEAQATFFMVGEAARRNPEIVRRVAQAGHAIGNHSWDHISLPSLTGPQRRKQIRACAGAIAPYGQRLFRPPFGHQSVASRLDALWLRYQVVTWNVIAEDWLNHDANWMADHLVREIRSGSVVLLHDAIYRSQQAIPQYDRQPMLEALNMVLERLKDRFRFITVPELIRSGRPVRQYWYLQP